MSWSSFLEQHKPVVAQAERPRFEPKKIDWNRLVTLDFETYYDDEYTLKKLSTSEYVRDPRFKAQMLGLKIGRKKTRILKPRDIKPALADIDWSTHAVLAHHVQFDGLILSHHYGVDPAYLLCTMNMARLLHSIEIGAGLDEVSKFYGGHGKIEGALEETKGVRDWSPALFASVGKYCLNDIEECYRIFQAMVPQLPGEELDNIAIISRMFTAPALCIDVPRASVEHEREKAEKKRRLLSIVCEPEELPNVLAGTEVLPKHIKKGLTTPEEVLLEQARATVASPESFAELLRAEGVKPPVKVSPAWIKKPKDMRTEEGKWIYAFSKTDEEFIELGETHPSQRVRDLVETRLSIKSTIGETRAARLLVAGADGMRLPVYYKYANTRTLRLAGGDKMNLQNLKRGGELRKCILAPEGYVIVPVDSAQIEPRTNNWLWGQEDALQDFADYDAGTSKDPYCKFADIVYAREITKADELERFVGKVAIIALGYGMGAARLQATLALGAMGPPVFLELDECQRIVNTYRRRHHRIAWGWKKCGEIIEQMAAGITGSYKCLSWEKDTLWLPNGTCLRYPGLRQQHNPESTSKDGLEWVYNVKTGHARIYGPKMVENIVQALSKIIIMEQLRKIAYRYRTVMMTHDENVAIARKRDAEKALAYMVKTMRTPLDWCPDLPLNAEGKFAPYYCK